MPTKGSNNPKEQEDCPNNSQSNRMVAMKSFELPFFLHPKTNMTQLQSVSDFWWKKEDNQSYSYKNSPRI